MKNGASTLSLVRGSPFESGSIEEGLPEVRRREAQEKGWRDSRWLCQSLAAVKNRVHIDQIHSGKVQASRSRPPFSS